MRFERGDATKARLFSLFSQTASTLLCYNFTHIVRGYALNECIYYVRKFI